VRQQSHPIMPGWVWANTQAGGARIDTGTVWALTEYAHPRASPVMVPGTPSSARIAPWIYGSVAFHKTGKPHLRISVNP